MGRTTNWQSMVVVVAELLSREPSIYFMQSTESYILLVDLILLIFLEMPK
jgi:hypothetical protein